MWSTPSLPSLPRPLWPGVAPPDKSPIYGLNRSKPRFLKFTVFLYLNCVFMLNWVVKIELFWHLNYVLMLNWMAWNRTVLTSKLCTYWNKTVLTLILCIAQKLENLCRGVRHSPNECPDYDTKQFDAEHPFIAIAPWSPVAWNDSTW